MPQCSLHVHASPRLDLYRNCIADRGVGRLAEAWNGESFTFNKMRSNDWLREAVPQCGHLDWRGSQSAVVNRSQYVES